MNLPNSRDRAVPISALAESYGQSRRWAERELEQMVRDGVPVVACERGVYIAQTPQEAREYASALKGRIAAIAARAAALDHIADVMRSEQQTLWEDAA